MFEQLPDPQQFPDYYQFIKKPIALHEIAEKASQNLYRSWQDFEGDVLLVFANAQTYNMPDSLIAQDAAGLEHAFRGFCQALPPEVVGAGVTGAGVGGAGVLTTLLTVAARQVSQSCRHTWTD